MVLHKAPVDCVHDLLLEVEVVVGKDRYTFQQCLLLQAVDAKALESEEWYPTAVVAVDHVPLVPRGGEVLLLSHLVCIPSYSETSTESWEAVVTPFDVAAECWLHADSSQ